MTKFLLAGLLLVLLSGFLHFPSSSSTDSHPSVSKPEGISADRATALPLGEQIRFARLEKKISQKELADQVGLTKLNIEKIEKGLVYPQRDVMLRMQQVLEKEFSTEGY